MLPRTVPYPSRSQGPSKLDYPEEKQIVGLKTLRYLQMEIIEIRRGMGFLGVTNKKTHWASRSPSCFLSLGSPISAIHFMKFCLLGVHFPQNFQRKPKKSSLLFTKVCLQTFCFLLRQTPATAQKLKFSIKDFFIKCD